MNVVASPSTLTAWHGWGCFPGRSFSSCTTLLKGGSSCLSSAIVAVFADLRQDGKIWRKPGAKPGTGNAKRTGNRTDNGDPMDISTPDKEGLGASEMDDSILTVDFVPCVEEKEGQADNKSGKKAGRKTRSSGRKKAGASARKSVRPDAKGSSTAPSEALETKVAEWTTPVPFATQKLPRLDCTKLPPVLGDFCRGLSSEMQVSEESVLANALAAVATCAQSTYSLRVG